MFVGKDYIITIHKHDIPGLDAVMKEVRYTLRREIDRAAREITWREVGGDAGGRLGWSGELAASYRFPGA